MGRLPSTGDLVEISGSERHADFNGAKARIVGQEVDEKGRLTVRLLEPSAGGAERDFKIRANRLRVCGKSSSTPSLPSLQQAATPSDRNSLRLSSASSLASRRLGGCRSDDAMSDWQEETRQAPKLAQTFHYKLDPSRKPPNYAKLKMTSFGY